MLYFPHEQSGCGLLVFILPKARAGGPLPGRVPYMRSRLAWTVNKQQLARVYCTSGCLCIVLSTGLGSNGLLHTACACAVGVFVAYWPRVLVHTVTKNERHTAVHSEPPCTPFNDDFYITQTLVDPSRRMHTESITQASSGLVYEFICNFDVAYSGVEHFNQFIRKVFFKCIKTFRIFCNKLLLMFLTAHDKNIVRYHDISDYWILAHFYLRYIWWNP